MIESVFCYLAGIEESGVWKKGKLGFLDVALLRFCGRRNPEQVASRHPSIIALRN